jgi:hypothetical protein
MVAKRTELQQQLVEALLDSKAIDLEAVGSLISKFSDRAAREGDSIVYIVNRNFSLACGWPGPEIGRFNLQSEE